MKCETYNFSFWPKKIAIHVILIDFTIHIEFSYFGKKETDIKMYTYKYVYIFNKYIYIYIFKRSEF